MNHIFITVLNMSVTASFVAAFVIFARLLLKKAPKIFSYALWAVVLFRMLCPFSFESIVSILPVNPEPIPQDIVTQTVPRIDSGITFVDNAVNRTTNITEPYVQPETPIELESESVLQIIIVISSYIWLSGIIALFGYVVISYIKIKRRIFDATLVRKNIFETDRIKTPFVMGFIKPRIYIPVGINKIEADYIIRHEKTHIKRGDHLIKLLAFIGLALHWFNPLMWVSYFLMTKDMELSCDESVMKHSSEDIRVNYSASLLSLSVKQSGLPNPLAFGESNVKSRIKNVLNFKKHSRLIMVLAIILAVAVTIGCAMNRASSGSSAFKSFGSFYLNGNIYGTRIDIIDEKYLKLIGLDIDYLIEELEDATGFDGEDLEHFRETYDLQQAFSNEIEYEFNNENMLYLKLPSFVGYYLTYESEDTISFRGDKYIRLADDEIMLNLHTAQNMLSKYLPAVIFDNMPDFRVQESSNVIENGTLWLWSASLDDGSFIHKIEFVVDKNNIPLFYHYMNYSFQGIPENNITMEQAYNYVKSFAQDFIPNGEQLDFINTPAYFSLYDPGKVESWVAWRDGVEYIIMVNLVYGYVEFYMASEIDISARTLDFNISINPEQYNENPFGGRVVNEIFRSKAEFEAYCGDEVYAVTATDGLGNENMYLRPLTETYDDGYFENKALAAVTFNDDIAANIYNVTRFDKQLTAWTLGADRENKSDTRVFLIEVNKSDVAGLTEIYPGYDYAPVVIVDDDSPMATNETAEPEFYTYDEYIEMMEKEKALYLSLIDCIDENWIPIAAEPVLTQEIYDSIMINWEENFNVTLKKIENGEKIPKLPNDSYPYARLDTLSAQLDLKCRTENGKWILYNDGESIMETFDTKDDLLERARWWLSRGIPAGEIDFVQSNYVYRNLYNANGISSVPDNYFKNEIYRFISWNHSYYSLMNNDELLPEVDTVFAIWRTYLIETELGTKFDGDDWAWLIPVETVKNVVSHLYNLDGNAVQYNDLYTNKDNPEYFRYPDGHSPSTVFCEIQRDTMTYNSNVYKFDVIFYDNPEEEIRTEVCVFNYEFEQVLYKDSRVCYKFIRATKVK